MIHFVVSRVVGELNDYLNLRAQTLTPDRVIASSLFDTAGNPKESTNDKVVVSLVNVEQDQVYRPVDPFERNSAGVSVVIRPEVCVNLYLLFIANLTDYDEALKAISHVISFFQRRRIFEVTDPDWSEDETARVSLELFTLSFEQQNHLWGALGSKFMPCVLYKAGIVKVRDTQVEAEAASVEEILVNE